MLCKLICVISDRSRKILVGENFLIEKSKLMFKSLKFKNRKVLFAFES